MYIHMPGHRRQHSLIRPQYRADHRKICLCSADKEMHLYIRVPALALNPLLRTVAERICSITCRLYEISLLQLLYDQRVRPFQIIAFESNQVPFSPSSHAPPEIHADNPADALRPSQACLLYNNGFQARPPRPPSAGSDVPARKISSFLP